MMGFAVVAHQAVPYRVESRCSVAKAHITRTDGYSMDG